MEVGQMIAMLRRERNLGQKELAAEVNLSVSTISNYENGIHYPDYSTLLKIANYFEVTTDYLLGHTNYRYDPRKLKESVTERYQLMDYVDTILDLNVKYRENLMIYALFLKSLQAEDNE